MMLHNYGPNKYIASFHAEVDGAGDVFVLHDAIDNVEKVGYTFDGYYTDKQVDSICRVEKIPYMGEQWRTTGMLNEHTGQYVEQGFYVINHDSLTVVYSITDMDSLYRFKKRISKKVKQ